MQFESISVKDVLAWTPLVIMAGLAVQVILFLTKNTKYARMINRVPGPPGVPILGNAWEMFVPASDMVNTLWGIVGRYRHEPFIRIWLGFKPLIFIQQGKAAETLLRPPEYVNKTDEYKLNHYWLGMGLLNSEREKWEKRRRLLNHSFHTRILDSYLPIFNEQSAILVKNLQKQQGKGTFNAFRFITHCSLDILCETTMGVKLRSQENYNSSYVECIHKMIEIYSTRVIRPWLHSQFIYNLTQMRKDEIANVKTLHAFSLNVISERRKLREMEEVDKKNENTEKIFGQKRRLNTLDLLLEAEIDGKPLTDSDILEEVQITCVAGHETTASALSWTLHLLGNNLDIQKKAQEEIDSVLGEEDRPVTLEDMPKLKYLEAVIKEGLRLFPPVPIFGRKLDEDVVINGYTIPSKTSIYVCPFFVHRDPEVFQDPEKFDPERFLTDRKYTQFEYMPFSAGPRNCIGHRFAILEEKVVLARLLKNFTVVCRDRREDIKYIIGPVLHSLTGVNISLEKRNC